MRYGVMKYLPFLLVILLTGCEVEIPKDIIQPAQMEELLYDYHLANVMIGDIPSKDDYERKLYARYMFDKHNVTKEEFDSSMVWYTRNPKYLYDIYVSLCDRLDTEVTAMSGEKHKIADISDAMLKDTVNLWLDEKLMLMSPTRLMNRKSFVYEADSTYVAGDSISFGMNVHFIAPGGEDYAQWAQIALVVEYADSTYASGGKRIEHDGAYSIALPRYSDALIKNINGYIHYGADDEQVKSRMLVGKISLMRIHPPKDENE
ncbi:MAG: DUF4296 domain-containing protein [Bacteroidaceae bacterium]|nr:DUF4296 domain-containing protein [Bacteroidaceae bacterium]